MKINTNLSNLELEYIGHKLQDLAKSSKRIKLENPAEEELFRQTNLAFDTLLDNLQKDISKLLL